MSRASIYDNSARKEARRIQLEEERRKQELQNVVMAVLPAYNTGGNWRSGVELGEEVIIANADEWQQKANEAAAQAEEYAQSAMRAESRGDMEVASILWGDSWSYDQKAQNYSTEATRYEQMLTNTASTPVFTAPGTAPKPKITTPGAERAAATMPTPTVTIGSGESTPSAAESTATTPTGTYADREGLELRIKNLQSEMQAYYDASAGKADPQVMVWYANQIHDAMKAMEALPKEPVREDVLLQGLAGNYYQGERTKAGTILELGLGVTPFQIVTDARDIIYDLQNWDEVSTMQKIGDISALLSVTNGLKNATRALELLKQSGKVSAAVTDAAQSLAAAVYFLGGKAVDGVGGLLKKVGNATGGLQYADEATEALATAGRLGDDLVDAGRAAAHLAESGTAAAEGTKLTDRLMEAGQTANKMLADAGNVGYSSPVIATVSPDTVRFSQKTVNGSTQMVEDMKINGWHGEPIDVVKMPDGGLTAVDNTRLRAANLSNTDVLIRVHDYNEPFPVNQLERFGSKKTLPTTWGDAVRIRINDQGATFRMNNPCGTFILPRENNFKFTDTVK